jgi:hypothetical protein
MSYVTFGKAISEINYAALKMEAKDFCKLFVLTVFKGEYIASHPRRTLF